MKVFFTCAASSDTQRIVDLQNSIYSTPGVEARYLNANIVSADLAVAVMERESDELNAAIHIRMALQKPILVFHPFELLPPQWIWGMMERMYVNDRHHARIIAFSTHEQIVESVEKYAALYSNREIRRLVY